MREHWRAVTSGRVYWLHLLLLPSPSLAARALPSLPPRSAAGEGRAAAGLRVMRGWGGGQPLVVFQTWVSQWWSSRPGAPLPPATPAQLSLPRSPLLLPHPISRPHTRPSPSSAPRIPCPPRVRRRGLADMG
eukprot:1295074-Rhodomonas_salina.1